MKLTPRFTFVFILYALALLIGVGLLAYNSGRDSLRTATISELQSTALEKEAALKQWVEQNQADITALADDPFLIDQASTLLMADPASSEYNAAHDAFLGNVQPFLADGRFLEVSLIHPQTGEVIASTDSREEGKFKEDRPYFLNGKTTPNVQNLYYSISLQSIAMTAAAPLRTPDHKLAGVLAARLDLERMNAIINRRTGLHETDEAYLVNTSSFFVTQPRFMSDPAVLQRGVHSNAVTECLKKKSGVIEAADYRNVPAFVVYHWLEDRHLCLIVKLDQAEAYRPVRAFGGTIALISALALLVAAGIAFALARGLTHPILALQDGAARFANGELNLRLDESSRDELGQLAVEFNKMAEALTEQQTHLRRRAERFFNLTLDVLCTINPSGRLLDVNPAWEQILGYTHEELRGHLLTDLVHPDDRSLTASALQAVSSETPGRFESRFRHKEGRYCWLAWVVVRSAQDPILYAAARDVTERRFSEEQLRKQAEELERSNQELEQFGYVASHDLQEPLRLVTNNVELLARRYQGQLDSRADEFIGYTLEGADRMRNLLADLLAYSQVGTRDKVFAPLALEETLEQVIQNLQLVMEANNVTITHDPLPSVLGDASQMMQLLQNLIGNAIKFKSKEPPRIHIGVRQLEERWLIFVRDNGIGIDPKYTEQVFVIFQRLHAPNHYPGTGIGLAIARKIVERHGGRIWVDSEPGKGATFYFTLLPAEVLPSESVPPQISKPQSKDTITDRATDLI